MATHELAQAQWHGYFDTVSRSLLGKSAEIEIASLGLGDQVEAEWLPLLGITYEPKSDTLEVALVGVTHMIRRPKSVFVDEGTGGLTSMEAIDGGGTRHIVNLREPLMLPAA